MKNQNRMTFCAIAFLTLALFAMSYRISNLEGQVSALTTNVCALTTIVCQTVEPEMPSPSE